jgi:hypothetical protein
MEEISLLADDLFSSQEGLSFMLLFYLFIIITTAAAGYTFKKMGVSSWVYIILNTLHKWAR